MDQILLGVQDKADKSNVEYFLYDTGSLQAFLRGLEFFPASYMMLSLLFRSHLIDEKTILRPFA